MKTVHHILLLMILLTFEACRPKTIERRGRSIDVTAIVVPYNLERTEQSLLRAAGMRHFPRNGFPAGYFAVPGMGTFPLYPLDPVRERLRPEQIDYRQRRPRNLSLERFVKAAPASHGKCYVMLGASDNMWNSEFYLDGHPVPFSCSYVLELKPIGERATSVEIFELRPFIQAGTIRTLGPSFGIVTLQDRRDVPPTTSDRLAVLEFLKAKISE